MPRAWEKLSLDELLDVRLCDLDLRIDKTWLVPIIERVRLDLSERGITFEPYFWLADEWFTPDQVAGVAIPFYLAHKRLMQLERRQMFEVEGGTRGQCLKILRHEVGHVIDHAYRLSRRKSWQAAFGNPSTPYPSAYRPNPRSMRFVQHLDGWYAQSHPAEDFAETFAVWLTPGSRWRKQYQGWPALKKLEYVDELMGKIADEAPKVSRRRATPFSLPRLRHTLRTHYQRKRAHYTVGYSDHFDHDLLKIFSDAPEHRRRPTAADFLRRNRGEIRELVARWTGQYQFTLEQVLKEMTGRCRQLKLRLRVPERQAKIDFAVMLAVQTAQYLHVGGEWHAV